MQILFRRTCALIVVVGITCPASCRIVSAFDDAVPRRPPDECDGDQARLPIRIHVAPDLQLQVDAMLRQSATFRQQCRRLAATPLLYVRVRIDGRLAESRFRARAEIQRFESGVIIAVVDVRPSGPNAEWIAHEFEHVLEQVDRVPLASLADRSGQVWRTAEHTFESARAIRAGRTVVDEIRRKPGIDRLVE